MTHGTKCDEWLKAGKMPQRLLLSGFGRSWNTALDLAAALQQMPVKTIEAGVHADTLLLADDGQSFKVGDEHQPTTNTARGLIEWINKKPVSARRIVILENLERASNTALQALLKVLEEPPPQAQFIITTQNHHRLLPTILSRVTLTVLPHDFDAFEVSAVAKDFLESSDLHLKFQQIDRLRKAEKDPETKGAIFQFTDELLLHARFFPQYHQHLEAVFTARTQLGQNLNQKLVLETLAITCTKP